MYPVNISRVLALISAFEGYYWTGTTQQADSLGRDWCSLSRWIAGSLDFGPRGFDTYMAECDSSHYSVCMICEENYWLEVQRSSFSCKLCQCEVGSYKNSKCYGRDNGCALCPGGTYAVGQTTSCLSCTAGKYVGTHACKHSLTLADRYSLAGATSCSSCANGTSTKLGDSVCYDCAAGWFSVGDGCERCPVGQTSVRKSSSCAPCAPGYVTPFSTFCEPCPAGKFSPNSTQLCQLCPNGTFSEAGWSACQACPVGKFAGSSGRSSCTNCEIGKSSTLGQSTCSGCVPGKFYQASDLTCASCATGTYSNSSQSTFCW